MDWVNMCLAPWCLKQRTDTTDGYNPSACKQGYPLAHHFISSIPEHLLLPITALHCTGYLSCILSQIPRPDREPLEGRKPWFFFSSCIWFKVGNESPLQTWVETISSEYKQCQQLHPFKSGNVYQLTIVCLALSRDRAAHGRQSRHNVPPQRA